MAMREVGKLEEVSLGVVFGNEPQGFTPWLADNLLRLSDGDVVGLELMFVKREHSLPGSGRVDILAKTPEGESVVIENQLTPSDDDHFLRLFGYAAGSDARLIIWVAPDFEDHLNRLNWLVGKGVELYAVRASGWRIGEAYAVKFERVVGPEDTESSTEPSPDKQLSVYARFYQPMTSELRAEGIFAIGGRQGGWTGRYRRYRIGTLRENAGITYYTAMGFQDNPCEVGLLFNAYEPSKVAARDAYDDVEKQNHDIEDSMAGVALKWKKDEMRFWVSAEGPAIANNSEEGMEEARKWMKETLMRFRDVFQLKLEEIVSALENQP